ncbi:Sec14p-like phosphatidylinositol transfer family protein [Rhynchospora pubera]|uniref:Sec14p-like phosphatidylinositol transfer family protein n=1 Tax=Rhynchospora pubera TaxID=906938 RepID=A0AAV8GTB9_9POAL|nr:Sec14p-like phosphatidylinositol transfer family protein [Rhynchospora pubera]
MSSWFRSRTLSNSKKTQPTKERIPSLNLPLESHWHVLEVEKKKKRSLSKMSFKSVQESLTKISRSNTFKGIFQTIHDPKEEEVVQSIRDQLLLEGKLPEKYDDYHTLLRFLRMRAFNVPKAKEMFLNMVKWREDFGVDAIVKDFRFEELETVKRCYPQGYHGVDRYGRPLYIERIGLVDLNSFLHATSIDRYIKYHITEQEKTLNYRYPACSLAAKKHIASTTMILDVKGVGLSNFSKPARELFVEIQKIDSNYYPETLNQLFIINAGSGFRALWRVLKAFLEARTLSKIQVQYLSLFFRLLKLFDPPIERLEFSFNLLLLFQVLGTDYRAALFEAIDPSNIPEFLGGTCACSASSVCLMQDKGPWTNPEINHLLEEVFSKGKKFAEEANKETNVDASSDRNNQPSDRHFSPNGERMLTMIERESETNDSKRGISLKINDLEGWLKDTNEILQKLLLKQDEVSTLVEDLKKLTSEPM